MSVRVINEADIFGLNDETHYQFLTSVPKDQYPQVHDFHELVLVTKGTMVFEADSKITTLRQGDLHYTCPGVTHSKRSSGLCQHINLAFPSRTVAALFSFLGLSERQSKQWYRMKTHMAHLGLGETLLLRSKMQQLGLIDLAKPEIVRTRLRVMLFRVFADHFFQHVVTDELIDGHPWLTYLLKWIDSPENLSVNVTGLAQEAGCSVEHLCRVFKKVLNTTPGEFLRAKRLNYAANMLLHSDLKVIDIAFQCGYQSVGPFYTAFKNEYGTSPLQYRKTGWRQNSMYRSASQKKDSQTSGSDNS